MTTKRKAADDLSFKEGQPGDRDLDEFALKIGDMKWEKLGLQLGISQDVLNTFKANAKDKPHTMLCHWRDTTSSSRPYEELYHALCHERVGLNNPAEKFCCIELRPPAKAQKTDSKEISKGTKRTRAKTAEEEKKPEIKPGKPSEDELEELANNIHTEEDYWKRLARRLGIKRPKITAIDDRYKGLSEKAYNMLVHWKQRKGCDATYEVLYEALTNDLVDCKELAEEYCCKK